MKKTKKSNLELTKEGIATFEKAIVRIEKAKKEWEEFYENCKKKWEKKYKGFIDE